MVDQPQSSASSGSQVFMMSTPINVATRSKDYKLLLRQLGKEKEATPSSSTPRVLALFILSALTLIPLFDHPLEVCWKSSYNPNARAAQHYNIVEDLAQAPSAMSALEVLQSCPSQRKSLLSAIGGIDPTDSNLICFDLENHVP
jgi:hypothetical protein